MKNITNKFQQYFDKLPDKQKKSLAQNLGTVLGIGMGIGTGAMLGDLTTDQSPIHRPSPEEMDNSIVTRQEMAEQFPKSMSTGAGVHEWQRGAGEYGYGNKVEELMQSKQTPIYEENTNQRLTKEMLAGENGLKYTAHYVDGTTSQIETSVDSLTDARSTSRVVFTNSRDGSDPNAYDPITTEKYVEGENSNLNGVFDMPFANAHVESIFNNTNWEEGKVHRETGIVKEVAYYTVDTNPDAMVMQQIIQGIKQDFIHKNKG